MFANARSLFFAVLAAVLTLAGYQVITPKPTAPTPPPATTPKPPEPKPEPKPESKPEPKPDTPRAIGQIQFGNAGCSATVIDTKRWDGRYWILTAAHCITSVGQRGVMRLSHDKGQEFGISVQSFDRQADCAWLLSDPTTETYPHAVVATASPAVGTKIWHAGFGVHVPGNREDGVVVAGPNPDGQIQFRLSVSSGDSGGGIAVNESGEIVSTVCCTTAKGQVADVWGASPESIRKLRPAANVLDSWTPIEVPLKMPAVAPAK